MTVVINVSSAATLTPEGVRELREKLEAERAKLGWKQVSLCGQCHGSFGGWQMLLTGTQITHETVEGVRLCLWRRDSGNLTVYAPDGWSTRIYHGVLGWPGSMFRSNRRREQNGLRKAAREYLVRRERAGVAPARIMEEQ